MSLLAQTAQHRGVDFQQRGQFCFLVQNQRAACLHKLGQVKDLRAQGVGQLVEDDTVEVANAIVIVDPSRLEE